MSKRMLSIMVALALILLIAGCSKAPQTQYDSAKETIEKARLAETEIYAPELFKAATDSLNAATVEMQKQDGKFAPFRKYGKSEKMVTAAQQLVEQANAEAIAEKERVRLADSVLIAEINSLITETTAALATAPKGKGTRIDLKVMQTDIDASAAALAGATDKYLAGSYLIAGEELEAIKTQVLIVKNDIDNALAQLQKK